MDIKSIYEIINYKIILLSITFVDCMQILGAYKNGKYFYD